MRTIIDSTNGKLKEAISKSRELKDPSLIYCLRSLRNIDENTDCTTQIFEDFAPLSFYFIRMKDGEFRSNGGIIYHGKHDGNGSGSAPTFSVCITPNRGWSIHT